MSQPFGIIGLDHVVLRAADPERLEAFYTGVLGCPLELRQEKIGLTQLRAGRTLIDIVARGNGENATDPGNMDHLCLRIEPFDGEAIRAYLQGCGVACGEVVDRYGAEGRGPSIYLEDPEGNGVELKGPVPAAG